MTTRATATHSLVGSFISYSLSIHNTATKYVYSTRASVLAYDNMPLSD